MNIKQLKEGKKVWIWDTCPEEVVIECINDDGTVDISQDDEIITVKPKLLSKDLLDCICKEIRRRSKTKTLNKFNIDIQKDYWRINGDFKSK